MSYDFDCDHRRDLPFSEAKLLVGGKAANLAVMAVDLGALVPPAFTITPMAQPSTWAATASALP